MFYKGVPHMHQAAGAIQSAPEPLPFISTWKTDNPGVTASTLIKLPTDPAGVYNATIDWGDGNQSTITQWNINNVHTYAVAGIYTVTITGIFTGFNFSGGGDRRKLLNISQFGILRLGDDGYGRYFERCNNLTITATDPLDLTGITTLFKAFAFCSSLTAAPGVAITNTSNIIDFGSAFESCPLFNENIGNWDVSSGIEFSNMFYECANFNQNLNNWNVSSATKIDGMFLGCHVFNSPLSNWDVSNVTTFDSTFVECFAFNQPLDMWDVGNGNNFYAMFLDCHIFDQYLGSWNVSNGTLFGFMFYNAYLFKGVDLGNWNITEMQSAQSMFQNVTLPTANYNSILIGWAAQVVETNVLFHGGNSQYSAAAVSARSTLVITYTWTIIDGGIAP
jgi:surface protein